MCSSSCTSRPADRGAPAQSPCTGTNHGTEADRRTLCITNVQRYSLHDGGGIRTVIFCKGCPFTCPWCCNPENLSFAPEVCWKERLCIGCSVRPDGRRDPNGCPCDTPPEACPTGAKELMGCDRSLSSLVSEAMRDAVFYEESGGGVTASGGEALAGFDRQHAIACMLSACKEQGVNTAIESTLALPLANPVALVAACDVFLIDFKIADRARSIEITGIDPDVRDYNLREIIALGARVIARMPIIPGYTDDEENVAANARRARELGITRADILPFHQLGEGKYKSLGLDYACGDIPQLRDEDIAYAVRICEGAGLEVVVHGE